MLAEDVFGSSTHHKKADFNKSHSGVLLLSGSIGSLFTRQLVGNNPGTTQAKQPASGNPALPTSRSRTWPPGGQHQPQTHWAPRAESPGASPVHRGASAKAGPHPILPRPNCQSCWNSSPTQSETPPEAGPRGQREIKETIPFIICSKKDNTSE